MNIVAIDDEKLALQALVLAIKEACPSESVTSFRKPKELLEFTRSNHVDIVFADIEMRGITGLELAKNLKIIKPNINIIFVTGYSQYLKDAFSLRVSGYLIKPVLANDILEEIKNLRNPLPHNIKYDKLRVQTFGNFEVFYGNKLLHFSRSKSKELFAYLIDRKGASSSMAEIASVLWEEQPYNRSKLKQIHNYISEIKSMMNAVGEKDVLRKERNSISINVNEVDCDYYKFLQGDVRTINAFSGEYMTNYSWSEFTLGSLSKISAK